MKRMAVKLTTAKALSLLCLLSFPVIMQARGYNDIDSLTPIAALKINAHQNIAAVEINLIETDPGGENETVSPDLLNIESSYTEKNSNKNTLLRLLKVMRIKKIIKHSKNRQRLFADMASVSTRLRLYPFAMQCYYQSQLAPDSISLTEEDDERISSENFITFADTNLIGANDNWQKQSVLTNASSIQQKLNDGKQALACALVLHVKQPSPGKRKAFTGYNNVGHMFITLIKYNTDSSIASSSFGFYPEKTDVFDGTPVHPASLSVIKDDAYHAWDEVVGKFISYRRMQRILRLLEKYQNKKYHLNKNNCTDFGLYVAAIGGIELKNTKGKWPFGKGNNPGAAGQSLLEGKISNADTGSTDGLFFCNSQQLSFAGSRK